MTAQFTEFCKKEIIDIKSGVRIGYADDVVIDVEQAKITSLIIYGRPRFWGLFGRDDDLLILWENIEMVGKDTILVKNNETNLPKKTSKQSCFSRLFFD